MNGIFWGATVVVAIVEVALAVLTCVAMTDEPAHFFADAPSQISFIRAFHVIEYEPRWDAVTRARGKLSSPLKRLRKPLADLLNEGRPGRKFDRAVEALQRHTVRVLKNDLN